jgi:hypothetical protein
VARWLRPWGRRGRRRARPSAVPSRVPETTITEAPCGETAPRNPVRGGLAVEAATVERRRNAWRHGRRCLLAQGASLSTPQGRTTPPHHREAISIPWRWARFPLRHNDDPWKRDDGWRFPDGWGGHEPTASGRGAVVGCGQSERRPADPGGPGWTQQRAIWDVAPSKSGWGRLLKPDGGHRGRTGRPPRRRPPPPRSRPTATHWSGRMGQGRMEGGCQRGEGAERRGRGGGAAEEGFISPGEERRRQLRKVEERRGRSSGGQAAGGKTLGGSPPTSPP